MCADINLTPKTESRGGTDSVLLRRFSPKVTPNAERLNMFNHSAYFNMSLSPVILNGAVTITPRYGTPGTGNSERGRGGGGNSKILLLGGGGEDVGNNREQVNGKGGEAEKISWLKNESWEEKRNRNRP